LVIMANDSKMTAFGPKSRYGLIHDVFGITPADQKLEPSDKHGQSISYEYMVKTNPDYLFVVDRGAAIGEETSAKQLVENDYVKSVKAVKNNHVVYLNSDMWYLAGGGLESLNAMIDEVKKGIEQK
ncbi:ABC transporter substrate-binding protein, partial [Bacillus altitudinis]|nr:ABC transporter substrate-binding protein [Bacillus altitudinis]